MINSVLIVYYITLGISHLDTESKVNSIQLNVAYTRNEGHAFVQVLHQSI
jgi:hypothetical protein